MKKFLLLCASLLIIGDAKAFLSVNLNDVCRVNDGDEDKFQIYRVEATELRFSQKNLMRLCHLPLAHKTKDDWNLNIYFGPFLAYYKETELTLERNGKEVLLSHINPQQRHSMEFYNLSRYKKWSTGNNPAQIFDEPQNKLTVEYESQKHAFSIGFEYIHPKIVFYNNETREVVAENNPEVLTNMGSNDSELYFASITTTKSNIILNLYLDKRFEILNINDKFKIQYIVGAAIGIHGSENMFEFRDKDWNLLPADKNWNVQGYTGNLRNKVEFSLPKARLNLRLNHDFFYIHYDAVESDTRLKTSLWGQFIGAQLGFTLH